MSQNTANIRRHYNQSFKIYTLFKRIFKIEKGDVQIQY